jgi:UDP-2,3-diacylglucosamine pyrophosphatase LpxH
VHPLLRLLVLTVVACLSTIALPATARGTFFVSDLHLGVGRTANGSWSPLEDFRWHAAFASFLDHLSRTTNDDAELVILGDMLELWQSSRMQCSRLAGVTSCTVLDCVGGGTGCSEGEARARVRNVVKQHAATLRALGAFAARGANRVVIVPGNHDAALLFPSVVAVVTQAIGAPPRRVQVAASGRWLSADKAVLAEHGHQFDKVNAFAGWPTPFTVTSAGRTLNRPGGELLVQTFYNRYEQEFETIDNFTTETEGIGYAIRELGARGVVVGVHEFAYFLLVRSTVKQRFDWLGPQPPAEGEAEWDLALIRKDYDAALVIESLPRDAPERQVLAAAYPRGELAGLLPELSDQELVMLCDRIEVTAGVAEPAGAAPAQRCPKQGGRDANLGYFAGKLLKRDDDELTSYLSQAREQTTAGGAPFRLFVFGHTHAAAQPRPLKVAPEWEVSVVNTGAFQRIATPEFIASLPAAEVDDPAFLSKLKLEGLPDCYSFVMLKGAGPATVAALRFWTRSAGAKTWRESESCGAQ